MPRILLTLSLLTVMLLATTFVVGLVVGSEGLAASETARHWMRWHFLLGTGTALTVVFVHSLVVTYLIGTNRWCKEVSETYRLDAHWVQQSTRLKRKSFPWSLTAMLWIVGVIALGAAADPATGRQNLEPWAIVHLIAASAGLAYIAASFFFTFGYVSAQQKLVEQIVQRVQQIRRERGLEVAASA